MAAVAGSLLAGMGLVALMGVPVVEAVAAFADGAWGSPYALAASINRALRADAGRPGLRAGRARQTSPTSAAKARSPWGGIAATALCLWAPVASLPFGLAFIVPMLGACVAGALWGGIAGVLKVKAGTNEVIATLLLSFIAIWLVYGSVQSENLLRRPMTTSATLPESLEIPVATQLPLLLGDASVPLHAGLPIGLVLADGWWAVVLGFTVLGLKLRAAGLNPRAARPRRHGDRPPHHRCVVRRGRAGRAGRRLQCCRVSSTR